MYVYRNITSRPIINGITGIYVSIIIIWYYEELRKTNNYPHMLVSLNILGINKYKYFKAIQMSNSTAKCLLLRNCLHSASHVTSRQIQISFSSLLVASTATTFSFI
jgi:hypothetical protein